MKIRITEMIHRLDQTAAQVQNPMMLETIAAVREAFLNALEQDAEGLTDETWGNRLTECFGRDRENSPTDLIRLLTEPETRFAEERIPEAAAGIRKMCMIQRNRIRFVRELESALEQLTAVLPEEERREETERIAGESRLAEEGLNRLLGLYRMKSREEQRKTGSRSFHQVRCYEPDRKEKERLAETADRVRDSRDLLRQREINFRFFF